MVMQSTTSEHQNQSFNIQGPTWIILKRPDEYTTESAAKGRPNDCCECEPKEQQRVWLWGTAEEDGEEEEVENNND